MQRIELGFAVIKRIASWLVGFLKLDTELVERKFANRLFNLSMAPEISF